MCYYKNLEYDLAIQHYNKCLRISEKFYDDENITMGKIYNNIGLVYKNQRKYEKSLQNLEKSLKIILKAEEENKVLISQIYNNIGNIYISIDKPSVAI